jgi:hypothetical protein
MAFPARFTHLRPVPWLVAGLLVACAEQPNAPIAVSGPEFSVITSNDPTRIVTVGVDAPASLTLIGTVAEVVVAVDNSVVNLSHATIDCAGQSTPDDPRIGVWIQPGHSHVTIRGGGTALIDHCGVAVLIGSPTPAGGAPGGSFVRVSGLHIQNVNCPQGPFDITDRVCDIAVALANSHDNVVDSNAITNVSEGGILVYGANPAGAISGSNTLTNNQLIGGFNSYGISLATNGNVVRGNVSNDPIEGIVVDGDANQVSDNQVFHSTQDIAFGIHLRPGAEDNTILRNRIRATDIDLVVDAGAARNLIRQNSGSPTNQPDAVDRNGNCTANSWIANDLSRSSPACILGVTLDALLIPPPAALQLDAPTGAPFNATLTNQGARLTDIAVRAWIAQGLFTRRAAGAFTVVCGGQPGSLPKGTCAVSGTAVANRSAGGSGTLASGPAQAVLELVHVIAGDSIVVDSRAVPVTLTPPATGSFWEIGPGMRTPRGALGVGTINGRLYAVGGATITYNNGSQVTYDPTLEVYDPASNNWLFATPMPTPRESPGVGVVNGVLYAVGGYNGNVTGALEAYDPATNQWTARPPMPTPRSEPAVGVVNGVLYAIGGNQGLGGINTVEAYDPASNSWTARAPIPTPRQGAVAGVVNDVIYVVGGAPGGVVEAYDPATNTWSTRASLPTLPFSVAGGVANGLFYTVGSDLLETNEAVYDPATDSWTTLPLIPTRRAALGAVGINGLLFTVGGHVNLASIQTSINVLEIYHP